MIKKIIILITFLCNVLFITYLFAEEKIVNEKNTEINVYSGMFDFSDDGAKSTLFGFQHQNEELKRNRLLLEKNPTTEAPTSVRLCVEKIETRIGGRPRKN